MIVRKVTEKELPMIRQLGKTLAFISAVILLTSSMIVATEQPCTNANATACATAKGADGKETAVMSSSTRMGDKLDCLDRGKCRVLPGQSHQAGPLQVKPDKVAPVAVGDFNGDGFEDFADRNFKRYFATAARTT